MRRAVISLLTVVGLAAPASAGAATPDVQILEVIPSRESVPAGIPTQVTFVVYVRNNGEGTTGNTVSVGPAGGTGTFTNVEAKANNSEQEPEEPAYCDPPGGEAPRCRVRLLASGHTQLIEFTGTITAPAVGAVTRAFGADVLAPDTEGNGADNRLDVSLSAVPGALPAVSDVKLRGRSALSAKQRRHGVGRLSFTLNRDADLLLTVDRRRANGTYRYWGEWEREGNAGANAILLSNRIDYRHDPPIDFLIRAMRPGRYRVTIVATDGEGHKSRPVTRRFSVPLRR